MQEDAATRTEIIVRSAEPAGVPAPIEHPERANLLELFLLRFDRPNTRRGYRNDLVQFFGADDIRTGTARAVTFVDVNAHLEFMRQAGQSAASIQRRTAALRGFYNWLLALGIVTHNPADRQLVRRTMRASRRDRLLHVLTREQARRLIEAARSDRPSAQRDELLIRTLLHGVLRRSEAAGMDLEHLTRSGGYWTLRLPSTKGGENQYIKLNSELAEDIIKYNNSNGWSCGPVWRSVSPNSKGRRLSGHSIYSIVKRCALSAGLDKEIGAHTLRHTGCTLAIEAGATVQQVQAHARHKNLDTTMLYVHQRDRLANSAADFIDL
ncbi:MAG: tyrosine-type recombinase/integrase [Rubricoccaceae bacterium]